MKESKTISSDDYDQAKVAAINSSEQHASSLKEITNSEYQIANIENQIQQLNIQTKDKMVTLRMAMINHYYQLFQNIVSWEHK